MTSEERRRRGPWIGLPEERFPHQHPTDPGGFEPLDFGPRLDPTLSHKHHVGRHPLPQSEHVAQIGGHRLEITVVNAHERGPKIRILRYKNKTGYRRRQGHRQDLTRVKVTDITKAKA